MKRFWLSFVVASCYATASVAATSPDLRSQIIVNGDLSDFAADDWVLDDSTSVAERPGDSRWGTDNDVTGIALTWDNFNLYIGVPSVIVSTSLMLFVDVGCGGVRNLGNAGSFRRNIEFSGIQPNLLFRSRDTSVPPELAALDCDHPVSIVNTAEYQGIFVQEGASDGALEVAIPWALVPGFEAGAQGVAVPAAGQHLRVLSVVTTAGPGMGAGDAAPDPSVQLENDSTRVAILNNYVELPLDGDGDGILDIGVSPRSIAGYGVSSTEDVPAVLPVQLIIGDKLFAPGAGESLAFLVSLNPPDYQQPVYLTGRVYNAAGYLVRTLFVDEAQVLGGGAVSKSWDGRDDGGNLVPGGVYVLAVSGGPGAAASKNTATASFAVVR